MPRRIPLPSLRPPLAFCKPTGIALDKNSRVIVALDEGGVGASLVKRLEKLGVTVLVIDRSLDQEALETQMRNWLTGGRIQGVYWLTALDIEADLMEMTLEAWHEANRVRVKNLSLAMRVLYDELSTRDRFLVTAVRLGGLHGYGPQPALAPMGGGVTGFSKAYKRERPDVLVKAVDFEAGRKTAAYADLLIAETLADPGVVEVGYYRDMRYTITVEEQVAADGQPGLSLNSDTLFLVTGAAGGITSAIVADLAAASSGIFYLLDLVAEPDPLDSNISLFRENKDALRQKLIAEAKAAGEKPTPVMIEQRLSAVERSEAALRAIEAVEAAGGRAIYRSVNLLDGQALAAVVDEIREGYGRIDVLIHAGGVEISKALNQKDAAQFDLVYDIKADGFFSLLRAAHELPIRATVAFSSVAGRFGNAGQTDYSAANDLLCKVTSSLRRTRPDTRAIVIDWTAWSGIGMATRGSIPKIMEMAGIEMLPPEVGIPTVRRELVAGGRSGEVLVGGRLGILIEEWDAGGGVEATAFPTPLPFNLTAAKVHGGWEVEMVLDPNERPFLYDHAMEGTPLLPGVMGTELFAELARLMAPGYSVASVFNEQFLAPFKFYRMEPQTLYLSATAAPEGDDIMVEASLRSCRELTVGRQEKLHFTASVRLSRVAPEVEPVAFTPPERMEIQADAIYDIYFHGPAYRVLESASVDGNRAIGLLAEHLPPNISPTGAAELIAPRLVELCFQTAGVWQIQAHNTLALPLAIRSVTAYRQEHEADDRLYAIVETDSDGDEFNAEVVDESGKVYVSLTGYRTVALPGKVSF